MSRNRLRHSHSLHWMGVLRWVLIVGLFSVLGLVYMLGKNQNLHLAQQTYQLQEQLDAINLRNSELSFELDRMKSPGALARRLVQMHSTLVPLDQMMASVVNMEQTGTRVRLAGIGTVPAAGDGINLSTTSQPNLNQHVASSGAAAPAGAPPAVNP